MRLARAAAVMTPADEVTQEPGTPGACRLRGSAAESVSGTLMARLTQRARTEG